jgi:uncharacterized protein (DUF58 family)
VSNIAQLRVEAEGLTAPFPPLLAEAEHLATTIQLGDHGRRRPGMGEEFWQYRHAMSHDEVRQIDWRRSGRSDSHFIREREWQAAQTVLIWVDRAASMAFASEDHPTKADRARVLALASAILLIDGGERVGLTGQKVAPGRGRPHLLPLTQALLGAADEADYGAPDIRGMQPRSRAVFISDFLGPVEPVEEALTSAADRGVHGALLQVLDPQEESFPFGGRTIFESMRGGLSHETLQARRLRERYLERLAERKDRLSAVARLTGWQFSCHHTGGPAQAALLWLYAALERTH